MMEPDEITRQRLSSQGILRSIPKKSEDAVFSLGAVQAQDYNAALWAIGLRCKEGTTKSEIESSIAEHKIVRNWLMRGTLHFAASEDMRWIMNLLSPRLSRTAALRDSRLRLTENVIKKTKVLLYNALRGGKHLNRKEIYEILKKGCVPTTNNLGYHMLYRAAWDGLICFGLHDGKQPTFALLDDWVPQGKTLSNEEAIAELTLRYFTSHGPATIKDFVWWSGLRVSDATAGIKRVSSKIKTETINGTAYYMSKAMHTPNDSQTMNLLPAFDEYLISYSDRSAMLDHPDTQKALKSGNVFIHSNGIFLPTIVADGKVIGTWKQKRIKNKCILKVSPFVKLKPAQIKGISEAAEGYGRFMESEVKLIGSN